ncbi:PIN domain-containing protein [Bacteroidia bacterium]|nr:PIN domain-containing protein [Bacteroidia bacterium]
MQNNICRVIIDTNVWISFLIGKRLQRLLHYVLDERVVIVTCNAQIRELTRVLKKPKIKKLVQDSQVSSFFTFLTEQAQVTPITTIINLCRDPKDNYLLSLSIDANANYLISGDDDLLVLQQINGTSIINFTDFDVIMSNLK